VPHGHDQLSRAAGVVTGCKSTGRFPVSEQLAKTIAQSDHSAITKLRFILL
jgi:hypothetical protein